MVNALGEFRIGSERAIGGDERKRASCMAELVTVGEIANQRGQQYLLNQGLCSTEVRITHV